MKNYNLGLRAAMVVMITIVFVGIAFDNTDIKIIFFVIFFCSILNDFYRRKYVKKQSLYIISFLMSTIIAGTMKWFFLSLMDGYLYILLIEALFRNKKELPIYLLPPHFVAFFTSDFFIILLDGNNQSLFSMFGNDLLYYLLGLLIMLSIREILIQKNKMQILNNELNNKNVQMEEYQNKLSELALSAERNRVAQELHDSLGHTLMAVRMNIKVLERLNHNDTEKEKKIINSLDEIVQDGINQLRETVFQLKNDNETKSLKSSLQEMIDYLSLNGESQIYLDFNDIVDECLPEIRDAIYKAVKECITNSIRHGKANRIKICISEDNKLIHLNITDNGVGCSKIEKSFGLQGIEQRFSALHGQTSYKSEGDKGFIFQANVPIFKR